MGEGRVKGNDEGSREREGYGSGDSPLAPRESPCLYETPGRTAEEDTAALSGKVECGYAWNPNGPATREDERGGMDGRGGGEGHKAVREGMRERVMSPGRKIWPLVRRQ